MSKRLLVCRVAWMDEYRGLEESIFSNATWVAQWGFGDEVYNFLADGRTVYGFVQYRGSLHIERLGAGRDDESVSGVTVVWTAPHRRGGVFVVGWYRNATVYRDKRREPSSLARMAPGKRNEPCSWSIKADRRDVHLVPVDSRWYQIPPELASQSLVSYFDSGSESHEQLRADLFSLVAGTLAPPPVSSKRAQGDPETRVLVEAAAIRRTRAHFESLGFLVKSVERDCVGWDLEAERRGLRLLLEVKGCKGPDVVAELTPNEFEKMTSISLRPTYRVCVVTNALGRARLSVFRWREERQVWADDDGIRLNIVERTGARVSAG